MLQKIQHISRQACDWALQEKHRKKAQEICTEVEKAFTEHPEQTGETYFQHFIFTVKFSLHLIFVGFALITHGLFPFLFTRTTSNEIEHIYQTIKGRGPKPKLTNILNFKRKNVEPTETPRICIVGGGFSGLMVLANLIKLADFPFIIEWFDEKTIPTGGIAYGNNEPHHLLNVRANRMGAFAETPEGFYTWLQTAEGKEAIAKICPNKEITPDSYVPRALYNVYLKSIYEETLKIAREKSIEVHITQAQVIDAKLLHNDSHQLVVSIAKGGIIKESLADALVLATGNLPPRHFSFQHGMIREAKNYVGNVWEPSRESVFPHQLNQLSADSDIVIIGIGLTMVDAVLTLKKNGYKGTITAISRHGWLPAAHQNVTAYPAWEWAATPERAPNTSYILLKYLRREIENAEKSGYDWRSVIDSLRPVTQKLWQKLPIPEKRKFVLRLLTLWNIHRHRMAAEIAAEIKEMRASGALKVVPGRIYYVGSDEQGMTVAYRKRGANRVETIRAALVLNCTGPEYDIAASSHKLLKNLRDRELITVGPLRIGVETMESGGAKGKASESIFPMGTLLVGELLECTAVPELRGLAETTAHSIVERLGILRTGQDNDVTLPRAWI